MGKSVSLPDVATQIDRYGPLASLVSVGESSVPHIGTVIVNVDDAGLGVRVGATTRGNMLARPAVCLAWIREDSDYQLILDGTATVDGEAGDDGLFAATITVTGGILHRLAGRPDAGPSCKALANEAVC